MRLSWNTLLFLSSLFIALLLISCAKEESDTSDETTPTSTKTETAISSSTNTKTSTATGVTTEPAPLGTSSTSNPSVAYTCQSPNAVADPKQLACWTDDTVLAQVTSDRCCTINSNGLIRNFWIHEPPNTLRSTAKPLFVHLHGIASTADGTAKLTDARQFGDRMGYVTILPNGYKLGGIHFWSAAVQCCQIPPNGLDQGASKEIVDQLFALLNKVDDVKLITQMIDELRKEYSVSSVFLFGYSNGAIMTQRLACEKTEYFTAAISAAGPMSGYAPTDCNPRQSLAMMSIHSVDDEIVPYKGGSPANIIFNTVLIPNMLKAVGRESEDASKYLEIVRYNVAFQSVDTTLERWRQINQCSESSTSSTLVDFTTKDDVLIERILGTTSPTINRPATYLKYQSCQKATLEFVKMEGPKHVPLYNLTQLHPLMGNFYSAAAKAK